MDASTQTPTANPFSLEEFLKQADSVSLSVLAILGIMSLLTWYVLITKLWDQWRVRQTYRDLDGKFWRAGNLREGFAALTGQDNVFRMLIEDGARALQHHEGHLQERVDLNDWMTVSLYRAADQVNRRLGQGLAILATTGSVSPFVGLFGTVWGIYNALISIAITGNPTLTNVSGPIGEALIMTAVGLFVAVPAVMGYNLLLRRNRDIQEKLRDFSADLHAYLVGGARIDQQTPILRLGSAAAR
jgi:biopolymer transport protein ExbB